MLLKHITDLLQAILQRGVATHQVHIAGAEEQLPQSSRVQILSQPHSSVEQILASVVVADQHVKISRHQRHERRIRPGAEVCAKLLRDEAKNRRFALRTIRK